MCPLFFLQNEPERKKGRVAKHEEAWTHRFDFGGKAYFLKGRPLDMGARRMISGESRKRDANMGLMELTLIGGTVDVIKEDGKTVYKSGDGNPPDRYDSETKQTLGDVLLKYLVTYRQPELADQFEDCFGIYFDEDEMDEMDKLSDASPKEPSHFSVVSTNNDEDMGS